MLILWDFLHLLRDKSDRLSVDDLNLPLGSNNRPFSLIDDFSYDVSAEHVLMCKFFETGPR